MVLSELTVGYVAGFIAAAIFLARLWSPNVLTFILSGILKDTNSAATWTAASTALQRSQWPWLLQSDSARNHGVRKDVLSMTWFISFMSFIIAIAGVVTPLGLHEKLVPSQNTQTPFRYLKDTSPFGYGTPPRTNYSLNRRCSGGGILPDVPCPFTDTVVLTTGDDRKGTYNYPYGYDISIPQGLVDIYSSGTNNQTTVSNYFDIEWRRYATNYDSEEMYANGSTYLVGSARLMQTMALNDAVETVEGCIVDTQRGGIGFRNHTIPPGFKFGVTWQEDILFIEPETECVNTNTTIDFEVPYSRGGMNDTNLKNVVLTDRGGFAELEQIYPRINLTDTQSDPKLRERAYKAAWMTNAYTALYYNVTNPTNETSGDRAWSYLNSEVGKSFQLNYQSTSGGYDFMTLNHKFDDHLDLNNIYNSRTGNTSDLPPPTNPHYITYQNFSSISLICAGAGNGDYANITNIAVHCGLLRGIPQRQDEGDGRVFEGGSKWSQPIYACASAAKATIKTVHFRFNGTDDNLKSLAVDRIEDKKYASDSAKPLWGVEDTGNKFRIDSMNLLWGLVADEYETYPNVSTVRSERLYLPGFGNSLFGSGISGFGTQNLPASEFYVDALESAYQVGDDSSSNGPKADYTGQTNMAMFVRWQELSKNNKLVSKIPNIIFADFAAAAVVGTKGVLGPKNAAQRNVVAIIVTPTESRIRYRLPFAIPAIIALLGMILMTIFALVTMVFHHHNIHNIRMHLQKLSPGRIFTTFLHPEMGGMTVSSREWSRNAGRIEIDMTGDYPFAANGMVSQIRPEKGANAFGREVSSERSTERDQFLGTPGMGSGRPQTFVSPDQPPVSPLHSPHSPLNPPSPYYPQGGQKH